MRKTSIAIAVIMALIISPNCWRGGYSGYYLPNNKNFMTSEIDCSESEVRTIQCHAKNIDAKLVDDTDAIQTLYVLRNKKTKIYRYKKSSNFNLELYMGEFNNDGISDFAFIRNGGGNGLGSEECDVLFMISTGNDYVFVRIPSYGFDKRNFVEVDGKKRILQTLFTQKESHSYWVHRYFIFDLFGIEKDKMMPDEWVRYTDNPNHSISNDVAKKDRNKYFIAFPDTYNYEQ